MFCCEKIAILYVVRRTTTRMDVTSNCTRTDSNAVPRIDLKKEVPPELLCVHHYILLNL